MTSNLAFTATVSIYHSEINLGDFRFSNYPVVHRVVHDPVNFSIKYHEQKFYIKFDFSGHNLTGLSIKKNLKIKFLGCQ